jgi:hypothetical protein
MFASGFEVTSSGISLIFNSDSVYFPVNETFHYSTREQAEILRSRLLQGLPINLPSCSKSEGKP